MSHLRNGEVMVDMNRNESQTGDAGTRKRSADSCYLVVGGSSDAYSVTVNFNSGHFCKLDHSGDPCKGNLYGKKKKYGAVNVRDTRDPEQWCKHVKAALADTEAVAEAQEITARAFGKRTPEPTPEPVKVEGSARERLAALETEQTRLRNEIKKADAADLTAAIAELVKKYGYSAVADAAVEAKAA